ncbi:MAG: twin-arginine translocation signal domain-containing protein, partial [Acidobacteria bacterium]|nr:twin-arginine translocation signal domain-containing protein [Acidobacteriota bacterium]
MLGGNKADSNEAAAKKKYSRRDFLATGGVAVAAPAIIATATSTADAAQNAGTPIPRSQGYIVFDSRKCIGCTTCMLACSLTHYGEQNLSLARIQIIQD